MSKILDFRKASELLIRAASASDAPAVRMVAERAGIDAWTMRQYADEASRIEAIFYVAEQDGEIFGFISGRAVPGPDSDPDGEIYNIAVAAKNRRRGIGKNLLDAAVTTFLAAGCVNIWLEVRASNADAIQFYENNGFTVKGKRKGFYSNPVEDGMIMMLELSRK